MTFAKWVIAVIFGAGVAYAGIVSAKSDVEKLKSNDHVQDVHIAELKKDVSYIRDGMDILLERRERRGR